MRADGDPQRAAIEITIGLLLVGAVLEGRGLEAATGAAIGLASGSPPSGASRGSADQRTFPTLYILREVREGVVTQGMKHDETDDDGGREVLTTFYPPSGETIRVKEGDGGLTIKVFDDGERVDWRVLGRRDLIEIAKEGV